MKKTIALVVVSIIVTSIVWGVVFMKLEATYANQIEEVRTDCKNTLLEAEAELDQYVIQQRTKYQELSDKYQTLQNKIYKYMETDELMK